MVRRGPSTTRFHQSKLDDLGRAMRRGTQATITYLGPDNLARTATGRVVDLTATDVALLTDKGEQVDVDLARLVDRDGQRARRRIRRRLGYVLDLFGITP